MHIKPVKRRSNWGELIFDVWASLLASFSWGNSDFICHWQKTRNWQKKHLEIKLEIDKNLENKLEIYGYFILENKLEIFEGFLSIDELNIRLISRFFCFCYRYWSVTRRYPSLTGEQTIFKRVRPSSNSRPSSWSGNIGGRMPKCGQSLHSFFWLLSS